MELNSTKTAWQLVFEQNQRRIQDHPAFPALVRAVAAVEAPDRHASVRERLYPADPQWATAPTGMTIRCARRADRLAEMIGHDLTTDARMALPAQAFNLARKYAQHRRSGTGEAL